MSDSVQSSPRSSEPTKPPSVDADASLRDAVTDQIGGVRGMVESSLPVVVFVGVYVFASLQAAIWSAVISAGLVAGYRLIQRDSPRHALTGLLGVAFAALIAAKTGRAQDFFLPGIITNFVYGLAFAVSAAVGRPLVGYAWSIVTGSCADWRSRPALLRAFGALSLMWCGVFLLRGGVQLWLYLSEMTVGLGIARIVGIVPYAAAFAFTVYYGRKVVAREQLPDAALTPDQPVAALPADPTYRV
ncbi:MAG: DUF3159 domain-containing protein [Mycobacteriales bacterium]